jgi:hypothetical protein
MDNTLRNVQDGGLFGLFESDTEKKIKDLNHRLKIVIAGQKKGDGFRIKDKLKKIIYEEETALNDLINSDFSIKKEFYRILKQWADLYTNGKVEDRAGQPGVLTKVFGFEKFLTDLDFVYGSPEEKISIGDGARTIYDDVEFYNILFPKIKEYMQQKVKNVPSNKKAFLAGDDMMGTLTILSSHFKVMESDLDKLKQADFCNLILTTLNHVMREDGQMYIQLLNHTYDSYPSFKDICPINKLIDGTLVWLEKDAATGKEEQQQRFNADQYNLILGKLEHFYKLEAILNLENNNKFKQILFGSKKEKGKIIKWMMYIRQYKRQMKKSDKKQNIKIPAKDGKMIPINYDRTFLDVFNGLMDKTYPTFFRTSYANVEKGNRPGFFSNLKNMFSTSKGPDKYFDIIRNDLYDELIKWLGALQKTGDYIRLLAKISDLFPDIIDSNKFLTYAKLNERIIGVVTKPKLNNKTGKPLFDQKFTYVKKDLESLGKLLQMHIKPGNHIDKLYNSKEFNNIFYGKLKILVEENKTEASKHGFTLMESNSENQNFDELQNNFNSNLFEKIQPKIGININTIEELSDLLDDYYDIVSIAQLLPKKISGQHPMANTEIIEKTKAIPISKKTFSNEKSKETFYKILIDMKNLLQADSGKPLTILHYLDAIIDPDQALSWHLSSDFYTKDQRDGSVKSIDGTNQSSYQSSYGDLEKSERRTSSDLIANAQTDEVSQILQDNLPEVSKLSGEIANLLKIIDDQGKKLQETDYIIDTLINDENSILEEVSEKVKSVDDLISSNDLDTLVKPKKSNKVKKVITVEVEKTGGSKRNHKKILIGTYKTGKNQIKNLYRSGNLDVFFYINNNKKRKRVDFDSTRISL